MTAPSFSELSSAHTPEHRQQADDDVPDPGQDDAEFQGCAGGRQ
jgi:hypothetical protein